MNREGKRGGKGRGSLVDIDVGSSLLLLGEFQSVAEDLDSLLLMTGSTCLGKLTVEAEHLPAPERTQQTTTVHKAAGGGRVGAGGPQLRTEGAANSLSLDLEVSRDSPFSGGSNWLLINIKEVINLNFMLAGNGEEIQGKCGKGLE